MNHPSRLPIAALLLAGALAQAPASSLAEPGSPHGAGPAPGGYGPPAAVSQRALLRMQDGREAAATVMATIDKLFDFVSADEVPNKLQTAAFLDREIAPYFDFDYMAEFVAGPHWPDLGPKQRKALTAQLESRILSGIAERLLTPPGQRVRYVRPKPGKNESIDVRIGLSGPPIAPRGGPMGTASQPLVFRMYYTEDGWKAFDVLAEGRSVIASYRDAFDASAPAPIGHLP
jgi:phospholipid transport system substrate-binding protein